MNRKTCSEDIAKILNERSVGSFDRLFEALGQIIEKELDDICEECKKEHNSVTENLILTGYKLCKSCRVSKTLFPI